MSPTQPKLTSCLNILRRTPPSDSEKNIADISSLLHPDEDTAEELFQTADPPLRVSSADSDGGKAYILCDHNRDGDSYRSPWSNEYDPPLPDGGFRPTPKLRELERSANEVWDAYRVHYYGDQGRGGTSVGSVYLWDKEKDKDGAKGSADCIGNALPNFAGAFMIRKNVQEGSQGGETSDGQGLRTGSWNSVHVVDVRPAGKGRSTYQLTATISLSMTPADGMDPGRTEISGSLVRQVEKSLPVDSDSNHIANIGCLIEETEIDMRTHMDNLYIQKTREVIDLIRMRGRQEETQSNAEGRQKVAMMLTQAALSRQQRSSGQTS